MLLQEGLRQPVIAADGHTYERTSFYSFLPYSQFEHQKPDFGQPRVCIEIWHICLTSNWTFGLTSSAQLLQACDISVIRVAVLQVPRCGIYAVNQSQLASPVIGQKFGNALNLSGICLNTKRYLP